MCFEEAQFNRTSWRFAINIQVFRRWKRDRRQCSPISEVVSAYAYKAIFMDDFCLSIKLAKLGALSSFFYWRRPLDRFIWGRSASNFVSWNKIAKNICGRSHFDPRLSFDDHNLISLLTFGIEFHYRETTFLYYSKFVQTFKAYLCTYFLANIWIDMCHVCFAELEKIMKYYIRFNLMLLKSPDSVNKVDLFFFLLLYVIDQENVLTHSTN